VLYSIPDRCAVSSRPLSGQQGAIAMISFLCSYTCWHSNAFPSSVYSITYICFSHVGTRASARDKHRKHTLLFSRSAHVPTTNLCTDSDAYARMHLAWRGVVNTAVPDPNIMQRTRRPERDIFMYSSRGIHACSFWYHRYSETRSGD
jgi:hypothetical protein